MYNLRNKKIIISHDVEFDEKSSWDFGSRENDFNFFPDFEEEEHAQKKNQEKSILH